MCLVECVVEDVDYFVEMFGYCVVCGVWVVCVDCVEDCVMFEFGLVWYVVWYV